MNSSCVRRELSQEQIRFALMVFYVKFSRAIALASCICVAQLITIFLSFRIRIRIWSVRNKTKAAFTCLSSFALRLPLAINKRMWLGNVWCCCCCCCCCRCCCQCLTNAKIIIINAEFLALNLHNLHAA